MAVLLASLLLASSCSSSQVTDNDSKSTEPPIVAVIKVVRRNLANKLEIASEFRPFQGD